jgi:hypothetical protein
MTVMRNILKLFVVLFALNLAFMTVLAADANLPINAKLDKILSIEVKKPGLNWELDPAKSPLTDDIAKVDGVFVSTNLVDPWTVDVNGEILNDGQNKLSDFMTLKPHDPDWGSVEVVYMKEPGTMWIAKGKKGVNNCALGFSQPVSWEDIPSDYKTTLTFTAAFA